MICPVHILDECGPDFGESGCGTEEEKKASRSHMSSVLAMNYSEAWIYEQEGKLLLT